MCMYTVWFTRQQNPLQVQFAWSIVIIIMSIIKYYFYYCCCWYYYYYYYTALIFSQFSPYHDTVYVALQAPTALRWGLTASLYLGPGAGCQATSFIFFSPPSLCLLCLWEAAFLFCYRDICKVTQRGSKLLACAKPDGCGRTITLLALCGFVNQMLRWRRSWWKIICSVLR